MSDAHGSHPRDRLSPYLDDDLGVEERSAIDRHLAVCEDCRVELGALRRLARALADESPPPPSADLPARIGRRLDAVSRRRSSSRRFVIPATVAATLAALGILVALQWREGRLAQPGPSTAPAPAAAPVPTEPPAQAERPALDELRRDLEPAPSPSSRRDESAKATETDNKPRDAGGAITRQEAPSAGAARAPAMAAKVAVAPPCDEQWSDSGLRARWRVADVEAAARELERIARDAGGTSAWRGAANGRPYVLLVPRGRFDEVVGRLRSRGVAGLDAVVTQREGPGCAGISVALDAGEPAPPPAPR